MRYGILIALVALIVVFDHFMAHLADQSVGEVDVESNLLSLPLPSGEKLSNDATGTCRNSSICLIYRYQFCFQPYTSNETENENGWHLVYHKPKPWLSVIMPARDPDSFYFEEMAQGEYILFVKADGRVILGDKR